MQYYKKTIVPIIEAHYENLSAVEKSIADFFISNREKMDFSSKKIAGMLYVSEASLSRFAKKCGYKGYREFIYEYEASFMKEKTMENGGTAAVFTIYQDLLNRSFSELTSPMILARIFPEGLLSKKEKDSV